MAIHEGIKQYKCSWCEACFSAKHCLEGHIASVHEGNIQFFFLLIPFDLCSIFCNCQLPEKIITLYLLQNRILLVILEKFSYLFFHTNYWKPLFYCHCFMIKREKITVQWWLNKCKSSILNYFESYNERFQS